MKILFGNFLTVLFLGLSFFLYNSRPSQTEVATSSVKVAFIGDSGDESGFQGVLNLIKDEDADLVVHGGDFSYDKLEPWRSIINKTLGEDFPYLGANGNHDKWSAYWDGFFKDRVESLVGTNYVVDDRDSKNYSLTYQGVKIVFLGDADADVTESSYVPFVNAQLSDSDASWKICSWHRTGVKNHTTEPPGRAMLSTGGKPNEMSAAVYEECRKNGAIIITAHEHVYLRTRTITKFEDLDPSSQLDGIEVDNQLPPDNLRVSPGSTFVAVSGLGGAPWKGYAGYDFSCDHHDKDWWWATIYTLNYYLRNGIDYGKDCTITGTDPYGNEYLNNIWKDKDPGGINEYTWGALFVTFNAAGDQATGYFKNVAGQIVDEFTIYTEQERGNGALNSTNEAFSPTPVADAYVDSDSPGKNYGLEQELQVDGEPSLKIVYLKFDLASLTGEQISEAKLRVRVAESSGSDSSTSQAVKLAGDSDWSETVITYRNRPELSAEFGTFTSGKDSLGEWQEVDVTELVRENVGKTITFGIDAPPSSDDGLDLYSRESHSPPQLVISKMKSLHNGPVDRDGDGKIGSAEFLSWFMSLYSK